MGTAVVTGGTDGIGRALAEEYLRRGFEVLVVGRSARKGKSFADSSERAHFVAADLSLVAENRRLAEQLAQRFPVIDVLVLGARYHRSVRTVTAEGFETNFALFYLSRFLLSHGLAAPLGRAEHPVVLNFGGAGQTGPVQWDDLQLERSYHGVRAMGHAGRLNDLLGVDHVDRHAGAGIRYVLNHPGVVVTSFAGEYDPVTAAEVDHLRIIGKPVATAVAQILPFLEPRVPGPLTAVLEGRRVALEPGLWDLRDARLLHDITSALLAA
ncbi:SDR family NAD(P)-dependent oxidoreductase [Dactylosporangium vinaceum]|uniref:SDR family NAD(P)-dependent oxidoreductase n=1 Tax=Dactylosporangium vinaceum TaxID=53362 RepID=A0ABV5M335_9ACTN|nr:SDR family NAD(P)-dependent oxidoreductase [Dactylosporangium vinaceum]UAB99798.1 SDR family NAD(P)-dependent oxidoreductase [Dactylosporangium vinaceum]